jgi:hypothetical protein
LPPKFPEDLRVDREDLGVLDPDDARIDSEGDVEPNESFENGKVVTANIDVGLNRLVELMKEALESDGFAYLGIDEEGVTLRAANADLNPAQINNVAGAEFATSLIKSNHPRSNCGATTDRAPSSASLSTIR